MKKFSCFKLILFLLSSALLLPLVASCSTGEVQTGGTGESGQITSQEGIQDGLPIENLSDYTIVYPDGGISDAVFSEIQELRHALNQNYSVKVSLSDDFVREGTVYTVREHEILIGLTNRSESSAVYQTVKKAQDYEVRLCGEKPVLAGLTDESLIAAIRAFIRSLLPAEEGVFFRSSCQISVQGSYAIEELMLGERSISEYRLIYPVSNDFCRRMAEQLAEQIQAQTGYCLSIRPDSDEAMKGEILIGRTNRPLPAPAEDALAAGSYYIGFSDNCLYLCGEQKPAIYQATQAIVAQLTEESENEVALQIPIHPVTYTDTSMTAMSFNVLVNSCTPERVARVVSIIQKHMPDTLGVQEANAEWMAALSKALADDYLYVGIGRDGNGKSEHSAVFYQKDRFTLIESGTKWLSDTPDRVSKVNGSTYNRVFSYALLERKDTHERFMHINTHTDHVKDDSVRMKQVQAITRFLAEYPDLPILLSGDFNSTEETASVLHILSSGMDNSAKIALSGSNSPTFKKKVIDFIFLSHGDFLVYEYTVDASKINGEAPSDHNPILIRYDLIN